MIFKYFILSEQIESFCWSSRLLTLSLGPKSVFLTLLRLFDFNDCDGLLLLSLFSNTALLPLRLYDLNYGLLLFLFDLCEVYPEIINELTGHVEVSLAQGLSHLKNLFTILPKIRVFLLIQLKNLSVAE